ncbi:MAG TPA: Lrp/AsnC ligand binding domain-containing protein [Candidatus Nanoarchaeia archaeon]|nr:Lrp/AsnC ligand binding domain-containing protein [Candidatus Nanoarchaeia archaeon]
MRAFVLISLSGKHEHDMVDELKDMPEVRQVYLLFGEWDIIAEVEMDNPEALSTFVIDRVRTNPKVRLTSSLIVAGN